MCSCYCVFILYFLSIIINYCSFKLIVCYTVSCIASASVVLLIKVPLRLGASTSRAPLKQSASAFYSTVRWPLHPMPDACPTRVFIIYGRWIPCGSHSRKMLPQPWYTCSPPCERGQCPASTERDKRCSSNHTASAEVRPHHYWRSRSTDFTGCPFISELNTKCVPGVQGSALSRINIPHWTVLTGVWISQSWSPPFRCTWWPCSVTLQNNEIYGQRCFAVSGPIPWNSLPLSVCDPSVTPTQYLLAFEDCAVL